ncbi:trafficking protein particle complex subunit 14 isoform X2 [Synchiropus splendidus]|uniref:trafficking protein particle complex subunit 14 isoform X2 n=1 Tax=Synchiropus splendidus TaxID=270530 RepID=UPI00237DA74F|nr:trafficking protein particle complex subunit 14 isoform X2 [Synchiropus splendidus]
MASECEYFIYFPAAPTADLSDPTTFKTLPRKKHFYLGEEVQFLLVLRFRKVAGDVCGGVPCQLGSLAAVTSVCATECWQQPRPVESQVESCCSDEEEYDAEQGGENQGGKLDTGAFTRCSPVNIHSSPASEGGRLSSEEPVKSVQLLDKEVVFCLTASLDKLPVNTLKAKIVVTVWEQEDEQAHEREQDYLTLLQVSPPSQIFKQDLSTFKAQVSTVLKVLPPPSVHCQQLTVSGKHMTVLKVLNCSSEEDVCVQDVKIIPNYNLSYLPMMPDGSVLIVDNVCHQSAEVTMASFCRVMSESSRLPSMLSSLEEQNFLFQLQLQDKDEEDSSEGLEVPLVAVVQWFTLKQPCKRFISTSYSLPSIRLDRPRLIMTASCPRSVRPLEPFWVKYTLLNNLQDFLAVRLIWNSLESGSVVCRSPHNNLGCCRKGSSISFTVAFQILQCGLFELSQSMKLKLQFSACVSPPPPPSSSPSSVSSPSPAARELMEKQAVGRSHSFSHQMPSRSHHVRSGSMMDRLAITPPVVSPVTRGLFLPPENPTLPLDKIAKRECKVLVLDPSCR